MVLGILVGVSMPVYTRTRERTVDREAQTVLRLIWVAQRNYRMVVGHYFPERNSGNKGDADMNLINDRLGIDLTQSANWNLLFINNGDDSNYCVTMARNGASYTRTWEIGDLSQFNATCQNSCGGLY